MVSWRKWKSPMLKFVDIVEHAAETHLDYIAIWHQGSAADERYASPPVQKYCVSYIKILSTVSLF